MKQNPKNKKIMVSILTRLISWLRKEVHTSREANSSHSSYSITHHNPEPKSVYSTTMKNLYDNLEFGYFKSQLKDEQKIIILYILRNCPQEIKDKICETIGLEIFKYLHGLDFDETHNYEWDITQKYI